MPAGPRPLLAAVLLAASLAPGVASTQPPGSRVECANGDAGSGECAADLTIYIGWRIFERHCSVCHAQDAEGSTFAPSLVERIRELDRRGFFAALDQGYTGPAAPLRPWGEDPQVARYYEELWAYLSARANGDVPPVPLTPLPADRPEEID